MTCNRLDISGLIRNFYIMIRDSKRIIQMLEADGWYYVGTVGSHWQYKHSAKPGKVTVPHPRRDIPNGTVRSIEKQSGLSLR